MNDIPFPDITNHDEQICEALASDVEGYKDMIRSLRKSLAQEKKLRRKEVRSLQKALRTKNLEIHKNLYRS